MNTSQIGRYLQSLTNSESHYQGRLEVMSEDLPWIDTVRWVTDFVTAELRQYWTEDEWREFAQ